MNPFLMKPDERLAHWKSFRAALSTMPEAEAFSAVALYWAEAPLMKAAYDPEDVNHWPGPWEMISDGDWCPHSVAIGMEFTLRLSGIDPNRMKVKFIRDYDISDQKFILEIDESVFLNYNVGDITEYPTTRHDILASYQSDGKRYLSVNK